MSSSSTADLCDAHGDALGYVRGGLLRDFGSHVEFRGVVRTVQCLEDNSLVKAAVQEDGTGQVLVIDGGGSLQRALVGDQVAKTAASNGWCGLVVHGCVRDAAELRNVPIGVKAMGTCPRKTEKRGAGVRDVTVSFGGVDVKPGMVLVADEDGVVVGPPATLGLSSRSSL